MKGYGIFLSSKRLSDSVLLEGGSAYAFIGSTGKGVIGEPMAFATAGGARNYMARQGLNKRRHKVRKLNGGQAE